MSNLTFAQKNDLVVKHKGKKYFGKDLELFQKHFPSNRLMNDLARANEFSFERLDGQMLYLLLDKISMEEILKNREGKQENPPPQKIIETIEERIDYNENEISDIRSEQEDKDALIETLEKLSKRIDTLEKEGDFYDYEISDLRKKLEDGFPIIEMKRIIAKFEKKVKAKKKANQKNSQK